MATILIGLFIDGFIAFTLGVECGATIGWTFAAVVGAVVTLIVLLPVEGFDNKECDSEYELIPLRRNKLVEKKYYIQILNNKATFAFDNSDEYELDGVAYQEETVKGKIILYESDEYVVPVLKVFKKRPTREIWTLAPFSTKTEYVFFVPMGSVLTKNGEETPKTNNVV